MIHDSNLHHPGPTDDSAPALKALIGVLGLFPGEMLDDMMADYFSQSDSNHFWLTDNGPVGVAYYSPERLTDGTWNLYLIAIQSDRQGQGRGKAMMRYVEQTLRTRGERLLLVETSGLPDFEYQRAFYQRCGYTEEARIRDFYQAGEDKVVFLEGAGYYGQQPLPTSRRGLSGHDEFIEKLAIKRRFVLH